MSEPKHVFTACAENPESPRPLGPVSAVVCAGYPIWLEALARIVVRAGVPSVKVALDAERALDLVEELDASLLLLDGATLDMATVLELVSAARERRADIRVILVADRHDLELLELAFEAGVFACMLRTADREDLVATVRHAFSNDIFLAPRVATPARAGVVRLARRPAAEASPLTRRELEILRLAAAGRSNAEVARRLWVTEQTVKFHLSNVYRKLNVANRTEAAHRARAQNLIEVSYSEDGERVGQVG